MVAVARTELLHRESHPAERRAGIVILIKHTFFVGNTIFRRADQKLRRPFHADNGEKSKGHEQKMLHLLRVAHRSAEQCQHILRNVAAADTAAAAPARTAAVAGNAFPAPTPVGDLRTENNGICNLQHRRR